MRIHVLGSGTSTGVPVIGCHCEVCDSKNEKDARTRASIALEINGRVILVDTAPELRLQVRRCGIDDVDAVLYTHLHADHCHGFDDLRAFSFKSKKSIPVYLFPEYKKELRERFAYAFQDTGYRGAVPNLKLIDITEEGFQFEGAQVHTVRLPHGTVETCGFRIGSFAYATDFKSFSLQQIEAWRGKIEIMIASGIHFREHHTHSVIPETLELFDRLQVKQGIITHLSHEVSYLRDVSRLPPHVSFAYDGMVVDL